MGWVGNISGITTSVIGNRGRRRCPHVRALGSGHDLHFLRLERDSDARVPLQFGPARQTNASKQLDL